jgi:hypothetical protein
MFIDTNHAGGHSPTLGWSGEDDLLGTPHQMEASFLLGCKGAGTLDNHLDLIFAPGDLGGITLGEDGYFVFRVKYDVANERIFVTSIFGRLVFFIRNVSLKEPVGGVVF